MKRYKPLTQRDIARDLGLSISTVSRVLNGVYGIGDVTRKKVMDYLNKTEYSPNPVALKLKDRRSYSIGIIVPEVANTYFSEVINGIEAVAYRRGYHLIVSQTHESASREISNLKQFVSHSVDGILVSLSAETKDLTHFSNLMREGMPLVFFDRVPEDLEVAKVVADNFLGAYQATEHLIKSGHNRIAHLTSFSNLSIYKERLKGYKAALEEYNIPFNSNYLFCCEPLQNKGSNVESAVMDLLISEEKPDAILTAGDQVTVECLKALHQLGLKPQDDISIVSFANITEAELFESSLTTVFQPAYEMGKMAAEQLIGQIENNLDFEKAQTIVLPTHLDIGSSIRREPDLVR